MITDEAKAMIERAIAEHNTAIIAPYLTKIKELDAETVASMREIALARERADKAEAEVATLRSMLSGATEQIFDKYTLDIQAYEDRALAAEAELAALRKRLVVDDEAVERASDAFWSGYNDFGDDEPAMRAALEAALGTDEDNGG